MSTRAGRVWSAASRQKLKATHQAKLAALRNYEKDANIVRHSDSSGDWFEYPVGECWMKVDAVDYDKVAPWVWGTHMYGYAIRNGRENDRYKRVRLHRSILGLSETRVYADHIDGDRLNNRRGNLRICTPQQNVRNSKKCRNKTSSRFKGVCRTTSLPPGFWRAYIRFSEKQVNLGCYFETQEDAAFAYNDAARRYFGEFANLNVLPQGYIPTSDGRSPRSHKKCLK